MNGTELGELLYRLGGFDVSEVPDGGAVDLAIALHGADVIVRPRHAVVEAALGRLNGRRQIMIPRFVSPARAHFLVAQMLVRAYLADELATADAALERATAAWIVAPTGPFRARLHAVGVDLRDLAETFAITQTCAGIRVAEVGGPDAVVVTPAKVYRPGRLLSWVGDEEVRAIASRPKPRSVRKVPVRDEPGRVALVAA